MNHFAVAVIMKVIIYISCQSKPCGSCRVLVVRVLSAAVDLGYVRTDPD